MRPAYIQRLVRFAFALALLLLVTSLMEASNAGRAAPGSLGLGALMLTTAGMVGRYLLYALPVALLFGLPAGMRPGSLLDRLLQLPVVLLAGVPAAYSALVLLHTAGHGGTHPPWLMEMSASLVVAPWLARALRTGLATTHGGGTRRAALACLGRVLQQYGSVAVCVIATEATLGLAPAATAIGNSAAGTATVGLVLPALLSHLLGDLLVTAAGRGEPAEPVGRPSAGWIGLGAFLALGLLVPALAVWGSPSQTDSLGRDLLHMLGTCSRCSLGLALGATAIATVGGILLGLLGALLGARGQVAAPDMESPSLLAPYVAGVTLVVWLKPEWWVVAGALGIAMAPWIAPKVRWLLSAAPGRRRGYLRAAAGGVVTVFARALYMEMLLGWMGLSLPAPAQSLGALLSSAAGPVAGAPHMLYAAGIAAVAVAGFSLIGAALEAER